MTEWYNLCHFRNRRRRSKQIGLIHWHCSILLMTRLEGWLMFWSFSFKHRTLRADLHKPIMDLFDRNLCFPYFIVNISQKLISKAYLRLTWLLLVRLSLDRSLFYSYVCRLWTKDFLMFWAFKRTYFVVTLNSVSQLVYYRVIRFTSHYLVELGCISNICLASCHSCFLQVPQYTLVSYF